MIARILLFSSLIIVALFSMLIGEGVEFQLVEVYGFNWLTAAILYRVVIIVILYFAFLILLGFNKSWFRIVLGFLLSFVLSDTLICLLNSGKQGVFLNPSYYILSLVFILLLVLSFIYFIMVNSVQKNIKKWMYFAIIAPTLALSFVRIVYIDDWTNQSSNQLSISNEIINEILRENSISVDDKNLLVPFFSTTCPYCKIAAKKIGISAKQNRLPSFVLMFPDTKEKVEIFLKRAGLEGAPYVLLTKDEFIKIGGTSLPSIFHLKNGESKHWVGEQFNNIVLWDLEKSINK